MLLVPIKENNSIFISNFKKNKKWELIAHALVIVYFTQTFK